MAITTTDIHDAADKIAERGDKPTLARIRSELGGGSFTTISDAMQTWRAQKREEEAAEVRAPEAVSVAGNEAIQSIWLAAQSVANAKLDSEREALEQVRLELQESQHEAAEMADQQEAELESARAEIAQLKSALEQAIEAGEAKALQADQRGRDLASLEGRHAEQTAELREVRSSERSAIEEAATVRESLAASERESAALRDQLAAADETLNGLRSELSDAAAKLEAKTERADDLAVRLGLAESKLDEAASIAAELASRTTEADQLSQRLAAFEQQQAATQKQHDAEVQRLSGLLDDQKDLLDRMADQPKQQDLLGDDAK